MRHRITLSRNASSVVVTVADDSQGALVDAPAFSIAVDPGDTVEVVNDLPA